MPNPDEKPSKSVIPLENVVATIVVIGVLGCIIYLARLWLR